MVSLCVCVRQKGGEMYEIKWPSLRGNMSNPEPLRMINACRQPFGCTLSKVEKLFTSSKIIFMAFLLHTATEHSWEWQEKAGEGKARILYVTKAVSNIWSLDLVCSVCNAALMACWKMADISLRTIYLRISVCIVIDVPAQSHSSSRKSHKFECIDFCT